MTIIFTILIALAWISPVIAGTINFSFELRDNRCVVVNRGDSLAYYPAIFKLGHDGRWTALKTDRQPAELQPGGTLTITLEETSALNSSMGVGTGTVNFSNTSTLSNIDSLYPVMIRFFDQSGVSFGQVSLLRSPPESAYTVRAAYRGNRFRMYSPADKNKIQATWVLAPFEEGIAPIFRPMTFTHSHPAATRIDWKQQKKADVEIGTTRPAVFLLHETPDGLRLQSVKYIGAIIVQQRTAWLTMRKPLYGTALGCALCALLFTMYDYRTDRDRLIS